MDPAFSLFKRGCSDMHIMRAGGRAFFGKRSIPGVFVVR
jgi:hypothetical protein